MFIRRWSCDQASPGLRATCPGSSPLCESIDMTAAMAAIRRVSSFVLDMFHTSQRDVAVFAGRAKFLFIDEHFERPAKFTSSLIRFDDIIEVSECSSSVGICEFFIEIFSQALTLLFSITRT